jgi:hypothetical protein
LGHFLEIPASSATETCSFEHGDRAGRWRQGGIVVGVQPGV